MSISFQSAPDDEAFQNRALLKDEPGSSSVLAPLIVKEIIYPMTINRRILCVDAQDDVCSLISTILFDYEVVCAHSKAEALRKATEGPFDLFLLNY